MHIPEEDAAHLRQWIKKKLRNNSDADPDVFAEYVVALLQSNTPEDELKITSAQSLGDFLRGDVIATKFVDEIFYALRTKSYKPDYVPPSNLRPNASTFNPPTGPAINGSNKSLNHSRKRPHDDAAMDITSDGSSRDTGASRPVKNMRRNQPEPNSHNAGMPPNMAGLGMDMPMNGAGFGLPFPPSDPISAMMSWQAMQAMNPAFAMPLMPLSGMPGMPEAPVPRAERCSDYETKGFCANGSSCPYDHGSDRIVVPAGPAADNAMKLNQQMFMTNPFVQGMMAMNGMNGSPSRGDDDSTRRHHRRRRASFSATGVSDDTSNKALVIENIPEKYLSEQAVHKFFEKFGALEEVSMQSYRHLAIVRFASRKSARAAYDCPDVVFENRFVKVFWYKSRKHSNLATSTKDESQDTETQEEAVDQEALQQKIAEAQKTHEDKTKRLEENKARKEELERKSRDLVEERKKLSAVIAAKEKKPNGVAAQSPSVQSESNDEEALKAKLAQLEAEAESLGLDPSDPYGSIAPSLRGARGRGRGGYYPRVYSPRGRGAYRGYGYRGRGGPSFGAHTGAVMRLDNRPKKVVISIAPGTSEDETMRQWLLNNWEVDSIEPHPTKAESQIISFKERYMAEAFVTQAADVLNSVTLNWFTDTLSPASATIKAPEADVAMADAGAGAKNVQPRRIKDAEGDLDVADDDYDEWR